MIVICKFQSGYREFDLIIILLLLSPLICFSVGDSVVELDSINIDLMNEQRILQGGKNFQQSCMSCHSLNSFVNDRVAKSLDMTSEKMPVWPDDSWNGHPPPDLSLIALSMSPEWLYTYLRTYYVDADRPTGYNNLVFPNTNMPNPFIDLQGKQVLIDPNFSPSKHLGDHALWYRVIKLKEGGSLSAEAFDDYVGDIVHFLTYVSDPSVHERRSMGVWVLGYLGLFIVITYAYFRLVGKVFFKPLKH